MEIREKCISHPQSSEYQFLPTSLPPCILPVPLPPLQKMSTLGPMLWHGPDSSDMQMMAVLQDIFFRTNITSPLIRCYVIPNEVLTLALQSCRMRRNLAARLAVKIYTLRERTGSNCRGKREDRIRPREAESYLHFLYAALSTVNVRDTAKVDKEMRNAVDEVCWKSKRKSLTFTATPQTAHTRTVDWETSSVESFVVVRWLPLWLTAKFCEKYQFLVTCTVCYHCSNQHSSQRRTCAFIEWCVSLHSPLAYTADSVMSCRYVYDYLHRCVRSYHMYVKAVKDGLFVGQISYTISNNLELYFVNLHSFAKFVKFLSWKICIYSHFAMLGE